MENLIALKIIKNSSKRFVLVVKNLLRGISFAPLTKNGIQRDVLFAFLAEALFLADSFKQMVIQLARIV